MKSKRMMKIYRKKKQIVVFTKCDAINSEQINFAKKRIKDAQS